MKLLLDTHAWLWFVLGDTQLSANAHNHIVDPANVKFVSPASYWEISTKMSLPTGDGPLDAGSSRHRLLSSVESALQRLGTDYIDLLQLHAFDAFTPIEEVL